MHQDLTAWIEQTAPRAVAYAATLVGNGAIAEELVQDCYLRLLQKSDRYDLPSDGTKLLFKSITNACINWTQRRPPEVSVETIFPRGGADRFPRGERPDDRAMREELSAAIDRALAELPVEQRAAVELSVLGHSSRELAEMLEVTPGHARVLLHRARASLADKLKPFLNEEIP
jgi:RNA polymerase sigma factor (sigma-70 family)